MESRINTEQAASLTQGGLSLKLPMRGKVLANLMVSTIFFLFILACFLVVDYTNQHREHGLLEAQIADATRALAHRAVPVSVEELELQLAQMGESLWIEMESFPAAMNSTVFIDDILKLADESGLQATPLITEPWSTGTVGEHDYNIFRFNLAVRGTFSEVVALVSKLEDGRFKTLVLEGVIVTVPEDFLGGSAEGSMPFEASLALAVYTLPRSSD